MKKRQNVFKMGVVSVGDLVYCLLLLLVIVASSLEHHSLLSRKGRNGEIGTTSFTVYLSNGWE